MNRLLALSLFLIGGVSFGDTRVTLLHFSDYHSHALPFYSEGEPGRGGIARALRYLKDQKKKPNTFVFSGGDMVNRGSPAWSDKYQCAEWGWLNGVVDAMAFGNHDADYGVEVFARCKASVVYPILGANVAGADLKAWAIVYGENDTRIGVIALAGSDFERLLRPETLPAPETRFLDRATVAKDLVRKLREEEKVHAVVLIGHAHLDEDVALAKVVPGIDLIFGTHSHIKKDLAKIDGTETWLISPYQYLTYVSRVELHFRDGRLSGVSGGLVPITRAMPEEKLIRRTVEKMQRDLERDPKYRDLFVPIGRASEELALDDQLTTETPLGNWVMDIVRGAAKADLALSTTSSFRQPLAPGVIRFEDLRATLPYPNKILLYAMKGSDVRRLLELSVAKRGSDSFSQLSGARIRIVGETIAAIEIGGAPLDDAKTYRVATTDYQAKVAGGYKEIFAPLAPVDTGLEVREETRKAIEKRSPISAKKDGRIVVE